MAMNAKQIEDLAEQIANSFDPAALCDNPKLVAEHRKHLEELIAPLDREDQEAVMKRVLEINNDQQLGVIQAIQNLIDEAPAGLPLDLMRLNERMEEAIRLIKKTIRRREEFLEKKK
jgi:predicted lipid carrier protein YhbT